MAANNGAEVGPWQRTTVVSLSGEISVQASRVVFCWVFERLHLTRAINTDSPPRRLNCAVIPLHSIFAQFKRRSGLPVISGVRAITSFRGNF